MRLSDLPTPCLVLDRQVLQRNLARMAHAVEAGGVALRPHMKTAKSMDVLKLAMAAGPGSGPRGITVSTLAEAEYFSGHGAMDMIYAVGITPQKLDQVAKLNAAGADIKVITDDLAMAARIAAHPNPPRTLIEIDCGEHRGGLQAEDTLLLDIAAKLGPALIGVLTHAGHSYAGRSDAAIQEIAEAERATAVHAAERLRASGHEITIVSIGSSPTALHGRSFEGITEIRPGVYMFGDLFQAEIGTHGRNDIAVSALTSVVGTRPKEGKILVDAGSIALSKDRSTGDTANDLGFGLVVDMQGQASLGRSIVVKAYQEHGVVALDPTMPGYQPPIGTKLRVLPNHVCLMAAAHDRYFVVDGNSEDVVAIWPRVGGW
ncbi:MAG: alanine racemase [Acetobacteraceae bacterium]|nr:alanine racemase [Acetobacteraceae bacterium]